MSVLIKGMEMPKSCPECPLADEIVHCPLTGKTYNWGMIERASDCPLVPVPPHGDLIDREKLYEQTANWEAQALDQTLRYRPEEDRDEWRWWSAVLKERSAFKFDVADAPTVIPAEEKEENFCADCHWYEVEEQYCFRNGCHAYNESTCEHWEPMPADEPIPAPGGKTVPTTYDLLYE